MKKYLYPLLMSACFACSNESKDKASAIEPTASAKPGNPARNSGAPAGVYHVYQNSGSGYGYQYKFELKENGEYRMFDKTGGYSFDPEKQSIRFTSGGLKDFVGIFTRSSYLNENRKLMIVLDFHENAPVPDTNTLGKQPGGYYQYAYRQEKK